jgi:hypothetical protein
MFDVFLGGYASGSPLDDEVLDLLNEALPAVLPNLSAALQWWSQYASLPVLKRSLKTMTDVELESVRDEALGIHRAILCGLHRPPCPMPVPLFLAWLLARRKEAEWAPMIKLIVDDPKAREALWTTVEDLRRRTHAQEQT